MKQWRCPATGYKGSHKFDPATHRCACGRWERGHKPKKDPVLPTAECQICECQQATRNGRMVHHGYKRPGDGYQHGDCYGVGHAPYPATDALEAYRRALVGRTQTLNRLIDDLTLVASLPDRVGRRQNKRTIQVNRGDAGRYDSHEWVRSFEELLKARQFELNQNLEHTQAEHARVDKRISAAAQLAAQPQTQGANP